MNLLFPRNPGFLRGVFNPYLFLALIVASYYGKYYGILSLAFSCFLVLLPLPLALQGIHPGAWQPGYYLELRELALVPLAVTLAAAYGLGLIRDARMAELQKTKERLRLFSRQKGELLRQRRLYQWINQELEQRILRQRDSITALYSESQQLYSLNLAKALQAILETVQRFTEATRASLWELDAESKQLRLAASFGWEEALERVTAIPLENSIEGWVVRNNLSFSVKMLLQYENLRKMDTGRNIMTFPVAVGRKLWGALNIEEMPFLKYNLYTEKLVMMILALSAPALERALEYDAVVRQAEVNPFTGLPSFTVFYALLQSTLKRVRMEKGTLSVIILELANFASLAEEAGREAVLSMLGQLAQELRRLSDNKAGIGHYKEESQLALLFPGLDYDGASLFSLETLSMVNQKPWSIKGRPAPLEMILGYASVGEKGLEAEEILQVAENILEMQKV